MGNARQPSQPLAKGEPGEGKVYLRVLWEQHGGAAVALEGHHLFRLLRPPSGALCACGCSCTVDVRRTDEGPILCAREPETRLSEVAATSKAEPWHQQYWILKCLQGACDHPLAACGVATTLWCKPSP